MHKRLALLLVVCLAQAVHGNASSEYASRRTIGFQAEKYTSAFSISFTNGFMLSDTLPNSAMYYKGRQDARIFYKNSAAFWIPFGATIGSLFIPTSYFIPGVATGLIMGFTKPKAHNLKPRDIRYGNLSMTEATDQLFEDSLYVEGYRKGAQQRRLGKAAAGVGTGIGVSLMVALIIVLTVFSGYN